MVKEGPRVEWIDQAERRECFAFALAAEVDRSFACELVACKHGGIVRKEGWAINTNVHKFC